MKRLFALIVVLALALGLTACGQQAVTERTDSSAAAGAQEKVPGTEVKTIRFATNKAEAEIMCEGFEAFKDYVESTSQRKLEVKIYYNSTLYTDTVCLWPWSRGNCRRSV